jgi:hypothetical protein
LSRETTSSCPSFLLDETTPAPLYAEVIVSLDPPAPNPLPARNSSSLLLLVPNSWSTVPIFLVFVSADCNFLFLISLLPKLSHPSPTALPTATARRSRAYGAPARRQKWWPSPVPEPAAPRPVGPGYEHAPSITVTGSGTGDSRGPSIACHSWFLRHLLDMATDASCVCVQLFCPHGPKLRSECLELFDARGKVRIQCFPRKLHESLQTSYACHMETIYCLRLTFGICTDRNGGSNLDAF